MFLFSNKGNKLTATNITLKINFAIFIYNHWNSFSNKRTLNVFWLLIYLIIFHSHLVLQLVSIFMCQNAWIFKINALDVISLDVLLCEWVKSIRKNNTIFHHKLATIWQPTKRKESFKVATKQSSLLPKPLRLYLKKTIDECLQNRYNDY